MSLPVNELQNRIKTLRQRFKGLPLQGQILDNIGKGRLLGMFQGKRLLRQTIFPFQKTIYPQGKDKTHKGVVDTSDLPGRGGTPLTSELAVEREKGANPVNLNMSIEL